MRSTDAFAELITLEKPVFTTAEASAIWRVGPSTASRTLSRIAEANLIQKVFHGIWAIGSEVPDPFEVAPVLVRPYPNYVSMYSALFRHGLIDQIPRTIDLMSLGRPMRLKTAAGVFTVHQINPESFGGFVGQSRIRSGLATAEKALVDTVTVLGVRRGSVTLPELDWPIDFNLETMWSWVEKNPSPRLKTIVTRNLERITEELVRS